VDGGFAEFNETAVFYMILPALPRRASTNFPRRQAR